MDPGWRCASAGRRRRDIPASLIHRNFLVYGKQEGNHERSTVDIETFIKRWEENTGGAERANFPLFMNELCEILDLPRPDPARTDTENNAYVYERAVTFREGGDRIGHGRIDLYKKGCFVLEAKQSRWKDGKKSIPGQEELFSAETDKAKGGRTGRNWDVLMMNARRQAEDYAKALPTADGWPPFILVCDVGYCIEVYADFSGQGKNYSQFPDRQTFRIFLNDLRSDKTRLFLKTIWEQPKSLDPTARAVRASREIAKRLAEVSKRLEANKHNSEDVAAFLMRCLFTMFAEDMDLLPKASFTKMLKDCVGKPDTFKPMVSQLWASMDKGEFAYGIQAKVRQFNGNLFKDSTVFDLGAEEIGELLKAAEADWTEVDPSIFGTLLEQALHPAERSKLGAHYTPRAYVERLVTATIMDPLLEDWRNVRNTAERLIFEHDSKGAIAEIKKFHEVLYNTRVLDPACGTGNFLYVSLELMKRLEGEVLEALLNLGGQEALAGLDRHEIDPHQFLGIELNHRARHIAELVLWIGFLQWHKRNKGALPGDPILRDYGNIRQGDAVLTWDGYPLPKIVDGKKAYPNAKRPNWPEVEFIVGNPPFIGNKYMREYLGDGYTMTLWKTHKHMNDSADFVMYWWDRAAQILARKGTKLRRFGLVTTNSITQVFQRRVMEPHLNAKSPISLVMAIDDHPWTKATKDSAAVRIAMTVVEAGNMEGSLFQVVSQNGLDSDEPKIELRQTIGKINSDLSVGVDVTNATNLKANEGLSSPGVKLHGSGFIVTPKEAKHLGLGKRKGLEKHIREYRHGRDIMASPRGVMVIDLFGLTDKQVREHFPEVFQHVVLNVKENKDKDGKVIGRDINRRDYRRLNWWLFGENVPDLRKAFSGLPRYIITPITAKHRIFTFIDGTILPDDALFVLGHTDATILGVLSSSIHRTWVSANASSIGDNIGDIRYIKSRCFDPFPFPDPDEKTRAEIGALAEEIDAHRKRAQAEHGVTLTQMYNVLEKLRAKLPSPLRGGIEGGGRERSEQRENTPTGSVRPKGGQSPASPQGGGKSSTVTLTPEEQDIHDKALVTTLKHLHDRLDDAVARAYGWPADLSEQEILGRLVALNKERAAEEARGHVRWLRPDYQIPRFGRPEEKAQLEADLVGAADDQVKTVVPVAKPNFPASELEQTIAITHVLAHAERSLSIDEICQHFKQGLKVRKQVVATMLAMARMGELASEDKNRTFTLKRANRV